MFDAINLNNAGGQGWQVSPGRCGLSRRANILDHERVDHIFGGHGHRWRDRELPPGVTMELFLRQVMDGNCACSEVRLLPEAPGSFTPSAYCQARARLPVAGVWEVMRGVLRELGVFLLAYNVVRAMMIKAAERQGTTPDRISFKDPLVWVRRLGAEEDLRDLMVVPKRPGRREPRAVKRRNDKYARLTRPRSELRKQLEKQGGKG